jgi:hypothetical protein
MHGQEPAIQLQSCQCACKRGAAPAPLAPALQGVAQKQQALLGETAQKLRAAADLLEGSIAKEAKDTATLARSTLTKVHFDLLHFCLAGQPHIGTCVHCLPAPHHMAVLQLRAAVHAALSHHALSDSGWGRH